MWTAKPKLFVFPFGGTGRPASTLGHALNFGVIHFAAAFGTSGQFSDTHTVAN